ncbi:stearoyl-CoA desaturase-like [Oppia nitens]|uniref:stearoyl-CoA desaturase-like n=1 Tax=Oppia nitens TaxID=1686743 RepID=UPI0023D9B63F|nr:stearoyl-CoA desaturase-like [Oppia nitens]
MTTNCPTIEYVSRQGLDQPIVVVDIIADNNNLKDSRFLDDNEIPEEIWEQEAALDEKLQSLDYTTNTTSTTIDITTDCKPTLRIPTSGQPVDTGAAAADANDDSNANNDTKGRILCFGRRLSQFKWFNILWLLFIHALAIYGFGYTLLNPVMLWTAIWTVVLACGSAFGASAGSHRLWAHRAFKARWLLKLFLVITESMAINGSCYSYARDHRNHHKFVDTDADPKNARRGFFYAHIGWWCVRKHPMVIEYGRKLTHRDLHEDQLVMWQHRWYYPMVIVWAILFPMAVPYYVWGEDLQTTLWVCVVLRTVIALHHLFTVNSIAHIIGKRPYDKGIGPTESKLTMYLSLGEGSHNYHHSFPMDYANCEKKWWEVFNPSTLFIDICKQLGLAYDLKKPSHQVVQGVIQRKGDPDYFERKLKRSLLTRIVMGIGDWMAGLAVAMWPVWIFLVFKLATGRHLIVVSDLSTL